MSRTGSMDEAWGAARRLLAIVAFALLLTALLELAEGWAHIESSFLHLLVVPVAFLTSLILVHGLGIFERFGF